MEQAKLFRYYGKPFELTELDDGSVKAIVLPSRKPVFIACKTAHRAYQKLYICSPLSAPTPEEIEVNMRMARQYMQEAAERYGCRTIAPQAYLPRLLNDRIPAERRIALSFGIRLLDACDGILLCGNTISEGMAREIAYAVSREIPVLIQPDLKIESWCMEL